MKPKDGVGVTEAGFVGSSRKAGVVASTGRGRAAEGRRLGACAGAPSGAEVFIAGGFLGAALRAAIGFPTGFRAAVFFAGLRDEDFAATLREVPRPLAAAFFFAGPFFAELRAFDAPIFRPVFFCAI